LHVVYKHSRQITKIIQMHEEFDAHGLAGKRGHIYRLVNPGLGIEALVEDRLQNVAIDVCDVSVLPVEVDIICCAVPVPKTQGAEADWRDDELLIE
jgi:hypothetical protein